MDDNSLGASSTKSLPKISLNTFAGDLGNLSGNDSDVDPNGRRVGKRSASRPITRRQKSLSRNSSGRPASVRHRLSRSRLSTTSIGSISQMVAQNEGVSRFRFAEKINGYIRSNRIEKAETFCKQMLKQLTLNHEIDWGVLDDDVHSDISDDEFIRHVPSRSRSITPRASIGNTEYGGAINEDEEIEMKTPSIMDTHKPKPGDTPGSVIVHSAAATPVSDGVNSNGNNTPFDLNATNSGDVTVNINSGNINAGGVSGTARLRDETSIIEHNRKSSLLTFEKQIEHVNRLKAKKHVRWGIESPDAILTWMDVKLAQAKLLLFHRWYDGSKDIAQKALRIYTHVLDALKRYAKKEPYLPKQSPYYKRMEATCKFREAHL